MFRRLMCEVEVFLRFSGMAPAFTKRDVIQVRGASVDPVAWREVVVKLLGHGARLPLQRQVRYAGERIKWFFMLQKGVVLEFMGTLGTSPSSSMHSSLLPKHVKVMGQSDMIRGLVFGTYDSACQRQLAHFCELFDSMLASTFENPWVFLKAGEGIVGPTGSGGGKSDGASQQSFDEAKERVPQEVQSRSAVDASLSRRLQDIPTGADQIDEVVDRVRALVSETYGHIRSQVCDQVELFAESFFKLPMLRRLEDDMSKIELTEADEANYRNRRDRLAVDLANYKKHLQEVNACIERIQEFKFKCDAQHLK